jgi:hypothetical protein
MSPLLMTQRVFHQRLKELWRGGALGSRHLATIGKEQNTQINAGRIFHGTTP